VLLTWTWDRNKAVANLKKHKVSFELAVRVFDDPHQLSRPDPDPDEDRWQTVGRPFSSSTGILLVKKGDSEPSPSSLREEFAALEVMADSDIDTSDIPEVTNWSCAERGRFYRPVKQLLSVRLDSDLVAWFKASGAGYRTRINAALREYVKTHSPGF
jgi:uncharacterized protein (DUF4415 family)